MKRRRRPSWRPWTAFLLALIAPVQALAEAGHAPSAPPDSAETQRLIRALDGAKAVRILVGPRSYVLLAPHGDRDGVRWERLENWPPRRPAVFTQDWDTIPPPPRPIPWEQIRAVDRRTVSHRTPILFGATIGALFLGGLGYGFANLGEVSGAWSYGVGGMMIGGVAGGILASPFRSSEWVSEYPRDPDAGRDHR